MKVEKIFVCKYNFPFVNEAYTIGLAENGKYFFAWGPSCPTCVGDEISNKDVLNGENGIEFHDTKEASMASMQEAIEAVEATKQKKEWYFCPICGQKLLKIDLSKKIEGVYIKCKKCRQEVEVKN